MPKQKPQVYYGLHMEPGLAEYRKPEGQSYRVLVNEETIKNMDPTFQGLPVYVQHVDAVDMDRLQLEADGFVMESFFNKLDGKHWVKFIVVSDKGHESIRAGWKLSNAYIPKSLAGGGVWHGMEYDKEVMAAEYEHLAIVPNPRYENSVILTPEDFKAYNFGKELELKRLANSKGESSMFKFFNKKAVENSADLESTTVVLPKSKREATLAVLLNEADVMEANKAEPHMANGDHHVMVGEEKMTVNDLVAKHLEMKKLSDSMGTEKVEDKTVEAPKANEEDEEAKKKAELERAANEQKELEGKKANAAEAAKKEADEKAATEAKAKAAALKNAEDESRTVSPTVDLSTDRVARGKSRYGSA